MDGRNSGWTDGRTNGWMDGDVGGAIQCMARGGTLQPRRIDWSGDSRADSYWINQASSLRPSLSLSRLCVRISVYPSLSGSVSFTCWLYLSVSVCLCLCLCVCLCLSFYVCCSFSFF